VTGELEDTEHAEDPQRDERAAQVLIVTDAEPDVVRQDGYNVDDAHDGADVATPGRRRVQPQQVLDSEDDNTGRVETEQFDAVPLTARLEAAGRRHWGTARDSLDHVGGDGQSDEEASDVVEDECRRAGLWVLERFPQLFPSRRFRLNLLAPLAVRSQRQLVTSLRPNDQTTNNNHRAQRLVVFLSPICRLSSV